MTEGITGATLRYEPYGGSEYVLGAKVPKVGDVLERNGDNWEVIAVNEEQDGTSTVILRPGLTPAGS